MLPNNRRAACLNICPDRKLLWKTSFQTVLTPIVAVTARVSRFIHRSHFSASPAMTTAQATTSTLIAICVTAMASRHVARALWQKSAPEKKSQKACFIHLCCNRCHVAFVRDMMHALVYNSILSNPMNGYHHSYHIVAQGPSCSYQL